MKTTISLLAVALSLTNPVLADEPNLSTQEKNQLEAAAKAANEKHGIVAKSITQAIRPAGTLFNITELHPASTQNLAELQGSALIATHCSNGETNPGINSITAGDRQGWFDACFIKPGDPIGFYVYGFKYSLITADTFNPDNGELALPTVKVGTDNYAAVLVSEGNNQFRLLGAVPK